MRNYLSRFTLFLFLMLFALVSCKDSSTNNSDKNDNKDPSSGESFIKITGDIDEEYEGYAYFGHEVAGDYSEWYFQLTDFNPFGSSEGISYKYFLEFSFYKKDRPKVGEYPIEQVLDIFGDNESAESEFSYLVSLEDYEGYTYETGPEDGGTLTITKSTDDIIEGEFTVILSEYSDGALTEKTGEVKITGNFSAVDITDY